MKSIKMNKIKELFYKKHSFIKVIKVHNNHDVTIKYYKKDDFNPDFLVNHEHVFYHNGYTTLITSDNKAETINPLYLDSAYNVSDFKTAIESKLIKETFESVKVSKWDLTQILLIASVALNLVILYFMLGK